MPPRVTLDQVAAAAHVSAAAASLALRGKPGVAPATRQRIVAVAKDLGYRSRPSPPAPAESTIGLLLVSGPSDPRDAARDSLIGAITASSADTGVDVRLGTMSVDDDGEPLGVPRLVAETGVDGFLVLGPWLSSATVELFTGRPLVLIDGDPEDRDTCSNVVRDDAGGAGDATYALVAQGHRRIALVGTSEDGPPSIGERRRGYHEAMLNAGLEPRYVDGSAGDPEAVAASAITGLNRPRGRLTAVVAANDAVGLAVLAAATSRGFSVPDDLSIIGFGDLEAGRLVRPRLSTVTVNTPAMGRLATAMLLHRIDDPDDPPFTVIQRAVLVERESVAPPRPTRRDGP